MERSKLFHLLNTFVLLAIFQFAEAAGQPVLNFKRLINNWPTIELYFTVSCDGKPAYPTDKSLYRVLENGVELRDFELRCEDPIVKCALSVALVFDVSGGMTGAGISEEKEAGNTFVDQMDELVDEAAILTFNSTVTTLQEITLDHNILHNSIDNLTTGGATAIWDGIYAGIQELASSGVNPCRAVIVFTDGEDNSSAMTPADVISLANRNRIRVFTVGLGSEIVAEQLETISNLTGGRYYQKPDANQIIQLYREITTIFIYPPECYITFRDDCMDGGSRTVDLSVVNVCSGTATKTKSYIAPKDTATFSPLHLEIGRVTGFGNSIVTVPLVLADTLRNKILNPAAFAVMFDTLCARFIDIQSPPGTLLSGNSVTVTRIAGGCAFVIPNGTLINGSGTLAELVFETSQRTGPDTLYCGLDLQAWTFNAGCFLPVLQDGWIGITDNIKPLVQVQNALPACSGDTVRLSTSRDLKGILWSTGDTTKTIAVRLPGPYWYTSTTPWGTLYSDTVTVSFHAMTKPLLSFTGDTTICSDQDFRIRDTSPYPRRIWSTGDTAREIRITQTGAYSVLAIDSNGCRSVSDSARVTVIPNAIPVLFGLTTACENLWTDYATLPRAGVTYDWTVTGGTLIAGQTTPTITIRWRTAGTGRLTLQVTHTASGCAAEARKDVAIARLDTPVIKPAGTVTICGDSVVLDAGFGYESYLWNTGSAGRYLPVRTAGKYAVRVSNGPGCESVSDSVEVTVESFVRPEVTGSRAVCMNSTMAYSTVQQSGHSYDWTAIGGSILTGNGTPSITVKWGTGSLGRLICRARAGPCADSLLLDIAIGGLVIPDIGVSGPRRFCEGGSVTLDAGDGYVVYWWSNGQRTRTITVDTSGSYTVYVETANGCTGFSAPVTIEVLPKPPVPVITQNGNILTTGPAPSYQWLMDGADLQGEINQFLLLRGSGRYQVTITDTNGCQSTSAPFDIITGIAHPSTPAQHLDVYPDPSNGNIEVNAAFAQPSPATYTVYTMYGSVIRTISRQSAGTADRFTVDLTGLPPGVYMITMTTKSGVLHRKFVVM